MPTATRSKTRTLLAGLALALVAGAGFGAVDPFYLERLEEGRRAAREGNAERAAVLLRIASFGMLEEPETLLDTLVELAVVQAEQRDGDAFRATFDRIVQLESRFRLYAAADLDPALRDAFEEALPRHIAAGQLAGLPVFADLAAQRQALRLERLPPRQRDTEAEALVRSQPGDADLLVMLARLEVRDGRDKKAAGWLDRAIAAVPGHAPARCLRGRLAAARGDCGASVADLSLCPAARTDLETAVDLLECMAQRNRWDDAHRRLTELGPTLRADPRIARVAERVERKWGALPTPAASPPAPMPTAVPGGEVPSVPPATAAPVAERSDAELESVARLAERLAASRSVDEARAILDEAERLAGADRAAGPARAVAIEAGYLASEWRRAAASFRAARTAGDKMGPLLVFYGSVSLYESGAAEEAAAVLEEAVIDLPRTEWVDAYVGKILGRSLSGAPLETDG